MAPNSFFVIEPLGTRSANSAESSSSDSDTDTATLSFRIPTRAPPRPIISTPLQFLVAESVVRNSSSSLQPPPPKRKRPNTSSAPTRTGPAAEQQPACLLQNDAPDEIVGIAFSPDSPLDWNDEEQRENGPLGDYWEQCSQLDGLLRLDETLFVIKAWDESLCMLKVRDFLIDLPSTVSNPLSEP